MTNNTVFAATAVSCPSPFTNNILADLLKTGGTAKFGLVKSVVAAVATLFLAKIPILLAVKALMLKLIVVPLAVLVLSLPVLIPAALLLQPLWKRWKEFFGFDSANKTPQMQVMMVPATDAGKPANATSATPAASTRALENNLENVLSNLLESEKCMERLACQLGVRDAKSEYKQQVSWSVLVYFLAVCFTKKPSSRLTPSFNRLAHFCKINYLNITTKLSD